MKAPMHRILVIFWGPVGNSELEGVIEQNFDGKITCEIDSSGHAHIIH